MRYWKECIEDAFAEAGIVATPEQVDDVVSTVEGAHENYSMAYPVPESPYPAEINRLEKALVREREKILCRVCNGRGVLRSDGPAHYSISRCYKCNGDGRHDL